MTGSVALPEYFANLTLCGDSILVWRWKAAWLVGETGRVVWSATAERRITSASGERMASVCWPASSRPSAGP